MQGTSLAAVVLLLAVAPAAALAAETPVEEPEKRPLDLGVCAELLGLASGALVIVDGREVLRVPSLAEEERAAAEIAESESSESEPSEAELSEADFPDVRECARRIGLPPGEAQALPRTRPRPFRPELEPQPVVQASGPRLAAELADVSELRRRWLAQRLLWIEGLALRPTPAEPVAPEPEDVAPPPQIAKPAAPEPAAPLPKPEAASPKQLWPYDPRVPKSFQDWQASLALGLSAGRAPGEPTSLLPRLADSFEELMVLAGRSFQPDAASAPADHRFALPLPLRSAVLEEVPRTEKLGIATASVATLAGARQRTVSLAEVPRRRIPVASSVPEPGSLVLMLVALAGALGLRRS